MAQDLNSSLIGLAIALITFVVVFISAMGKYIENRLKIAQEQAAAQAKLDTEEKQRELEQRFKQQSLIEDTLKQNSNHFGELLNQFGRMVAQMELSSTGIRTANYTLGKLEELGTSTNEHQIKVSETLGSIQEAMETDNTSINVKLDKLISEISQVLEVVNRSPLNPEFTTKVLQEIRDTFTKKVHDTGEMRAIKDDTPSSEVVKQN